MTALGEAFGTLVAEQLFTLTPAGDGTFVLAGEVDVAGADAFAAALLDTVRVPWVVDVGALQFLDVAGMRALALTAEQAGVPLELRRTPPWLVRLWRVAGFHRVAPSVLLGC